MGQLPQMVPPLLAPHEPSVVTFPVAVAAPDVEAVGDPSTGSWVELETAVAGLLDVAALLVAALLVVALLVPAADEAAPVQPLWQPFEARQWPSVLPQ